ncbi:MAG: EamA family transporter [Alphaproteobacteria bacterium]
MSTIVLVSLPFIAAMFYGLAYVLLEKVMGTSVNPATFLAINTVSGIFIIALLVLFNGQKIELLPSTYTLPILTMVIVAAAAPSLGWLFTIYSIKHSSALYTALAETSYPLFTMAFGFLIFGIKKLDIITCSGGLLVLTGAAIMIYGQGLNAQDE